MMNSCRLGIALLALSQLGGWGAASAQAPAGASAPTDNLERGPQRPPLFLREEWKQIPGNVEHVPTADSLSNPNLELTLIAPSGVVEVAGNNGDETNPPHIWTGLCTTPCGMALRHRQSFADLTGIARLRWSTKISGFHQIRVIVKLADGTWLAADRAGGTQRDWLVSETSFSDLHWMKLDITRAVTVGNLLEHVDLSKVDQIGFIDLMPASGHGQGGWSDVGLIEVYAKAVPR